MMYLDILYGSGLAPFTYALRIYHARVHSTELVPRSLLTLVRHGCRTWIWKGGN